MTPTELYMFGSSIGVGFGLVWIGKLIACACYRRCRRRRINEERG